MPEDTPDRSESNERGLTRKDVSTALIGAVASLLLNHAVFNVLGLASSSSGSTPRSAGTRVTLGALFFFIVVFLSILFAVDNPKQSNLYAVLSTGLTALLVTSWMYSSERALAATLPTVALLVFTLVLLLLTFYFAWRFNYPNRGLMPDPSGLRRDGSE